MQECGVPAQDWRPAAAKIQQLFPLARLKIAAFKQGTTNAALQPKPRAAYLLRKSCRYSGIPCQALCRSPCRWRRWLKNHRCRPLLHGTVTRQTLTQASIYWVASSNKFSWSLQAVKSEPCYLLHNTCRCSGILSQANRRWPCRWLRLSSYRRCSQLLQIGAGKQVS